MCIPGQSQVFIAPDSCYRTDYNSQLCNNRRGTVRRATVAVPKCQETPAVDRLPPGASFFHALDVPRRRNSRLVDISHFRYPESLHALPSPVLHFMAPHEMYERTSTYQTVMPFSFTLIIYFRSFLFMSLLGVVLLTIHWIPFA